MQRERGELVPIGDALSGLGGPVKAIRKASPQTLHHFTLSCSNTGGNASKQRISRKGKRWHKCL